MEERIEVGQMRFRVPRKSRRLTLEKSILETMHGGSRILSAVDEAHFKAYIRVRQKTRIEKGGSDDIFEEGG
jgi:hypothetical protein